MRLRIASELLLSMLADGTTFLRPDGQRVVVRSNVPDNADVYGVRHDHEHDVLDLLIGTGDGEAEVQFVVHQEEEDPE